MPYGRARGFSNIMFGKPQISCFVFDKWPGKLPVMLYEMAGATGRKLCVCNKVRLRFGGGRVVARGAAGRAGGVVPRKIRLLLT